MERHDCHVACLLFNHLCCFNLYTGNNKNKKKPNKKKIIKGKQSCRFPFLGFIPPPSHH
ncbi:hypothetical protein MUK42_36563 [Musa troglodytarum]|uniref:Uncharacterized protein n=1 Tax=Musa troglodytarum TaxID=320322 RepID=A0A9E7H1H0_9LILI|nr:hypothetical protein MUK42_36563 [Musa troglodytarum]